MLKKIFKWLSDANKQSKMDKTRKEIEDYYESIGHESPGVAASVEIEMRMGLERFRINASLSYMDIDIVGTGKDANDVLNSLKQEFVDSEEIFGILLDPKETNMFIRTLMDMEADDMLKSDAYAKYIEDTKITPNQLKEIEKLEADGAFEYRNSLEEYILLNDK